MPITTNEGFSVTDVTWYTPMSGECIGIVSGHNDQGEKKQYIGVGEGFDEEADTLQIAETGAKFYL